MRKGFTLIELIFVIVIIGVLAAVAVPKFKNLKQNAEASNVVKVASDAFESLPSACVNEIDLNDVNASDVKLSEIVTISGKNWTVTDSTNGNGQSAKYTEDGNDVVTITLNAADRNATLDFNCTGFTDAQTEAKCNRLNPQDANISF